MLPARPHRGTQFFFDRYFPWLIRRYLHGVYLLGAAPQLGQLAGKPLILAPTHGSWWDGILAHELNRWLLHRRFYVMMREENLRKVPFFRGLGAFGIQKGSAASLRANLRYIQQRMLEPEVLLTIFPEGRIWPHTASAPVLEPGIAHLDVPLETYVLPAHFHLQGLNNPRPCFFIRLGEALPYRELYHRPERLAALLQALRLQSYSELEHQVYGRCLHGRPIEPLA